MNLIGRLAIVSDAFTAAGGLSRDQQSYQIFHDQRRLERAFTGSVDLRLQSYERAMNWLAANWPKDAQWPEGVERPEPAKASA